MWHIQISGARLLAANRWTVAFFHEGEVQSTAGYAMRPIGQVAAERRGTLDPQQLGRSEINYIGLENVRSLTGELCDFAPRPAASVKSRSKIFKHGDVLFGRLRPELNKVLLCDGDILEGLCSGEFIVLTPDKDLIRPRLFRHLLASGFVTQFASRLKVGASLPRMGTSDLLGIPIPVPPMAIQERMEKQLAAIDLKIQQTRNVLETLPGAAADALLDSMKKGLPDLALSGELLSQ